MDARGDRWCACFEYICGGFDRRLQAAIGKVIKRGLGLSDGSDTWGWSLHSIDTD